MDEKGFVFTMDAALMLIAIFIMAATVANLSLNVPHESPYYSAQDALDTIYYSDVNGTIIKGITCGNTADAQKVAGVILKSFRTPYVLNYTINNGPESTLNKSSEIINPNGIVSVSKRQSGNITLILYMGR